MVEQLQVDGARNLRRTLKAAGDDLSDMKAAHFEAATIAANEIAFDAPDVTGDLQRTIRPAGTKTAAIVRAGNNSTVRYAGPINYGWFRKHIKPSLFMARGARSSEPRWIRVYENYITHAFDKIKGI